ncbi:hypothetical protein D8S82_21305 [Mycobacterium hodleri]|uniref:PE-PGRS family protein n=1 Tax=Mycolicibacterium hodleri TaxID=49897 RepID=A0A544VX95_9MYCO|nr:hypothetical protein [Mycolicibacterium hodleri]TQR84609.1 hypothetical protein D8S82_21305 [Mycolicibacterium hodleri]
MSVHVAVRSYLTAGVAVVGASALIAAPLAVPPTEIHLPAIHASSAEVQLAALANPIAEWVTVVQTTFANVAGLGQQFQSDPAPILAQILKNQLADAATVSTALNEAARGFMTQAATLPAATRLAAQQLAAGQFSMAVTTLFQAGIGLILAPAISLIGATSVVTDTAQRFANVVAALPNVLLPIGLGLLSPVGSAVYAFGDAGQAVVDAARKGDVAGALNALVNIPAIVTNAFLNGYAPQFTPGIFSSLANGGLIANLLNARDVIAQALSSALPPAASAASLPSSAKLISLSAAPTDAAQVGDTAAKTGTTTAGVTTEAAPEPATEVTTAPTAPVVTEPVAVTTEPTTEPTTATEPVTAATEPAASTPAESAGDTTKNESESTGTLSSTESTATESSTSTSSKPSTKPTSTKPSDDDKAPSSTSTSSSGSSSSSASSDATKSTSASTGSTGKPASSKKDSSAGSASSGSEGSGASSAS